MAIKQPNAAAVTGAVEMRALAGQTMVDAVQGLLSTNPLAGRSLLQDGFGTSLANSGVEYREYALRTIGMLAAIGDCGDQLDIYLKAALEHGATEAEVLSVLNQVAEYAGFPRAVNAIRLCQSRLAAARSEHNPYKEVVVRLSDHETLVRDTGGDGVPMLLIHALCMDGLMFQRLIPSMRAKYPGLRLLTYDVRGHGHARGAPRTKSLDHLVSDLHQLLDALEIPKVDVVGSSYGGAIAQYFALAHPERARALCPMATGGQGNPELLSRATRAEAGEMPALRTEGMIRWFLPETIADNTWCIRYARAKLDHVSVVEWADAWRAMAALDTLDRIHVLDCPVLVLAGEKDASGTPARMKMIDQAFKDAGKKNSEYVEIPQGTHMMPMEAPEEVAEALVSWRRKVDSITA